MKGKVRPRTQNRISYPQLYDSYQIDIRFLAYLPVYNI